MAKKLLWILGLAVGVLQAQPFSPLHDSLAVFTLRGIHDGVLRHRTASKHCGEALLHHHSLAAMLAALPGIADCNASSRSPENGAKTRALLEELQSWQIPGTFSPSPDTATQLASALAGLPAVVALFDGRKQEDKIAFQQALAAQIQAVLRANAWAVLVTKPASPSQPAHSQPAAAIHADDEASYTINYPLLLAIIGFILAAVMGFLYWRERQKRQPVSASASFDPGQAPPAIPPASNLQQSLHARYKQQAGAEKNTPVQKPEPPVLQAVPMPKQEERPAETPLPMPKETIAPLPEPPASPPAVAPKPIAMRTRFFSFPDGSGFSDAAGLDKFRPGVSVFEMHISDGEGGNEATFTVADRPEAMFQALSDDLQYLNPVCSYANPFRADATRINTQTPGTARLEGSQWVVTQKAVIQFI